MVILEVQGCLGVRFGGLGMSLGVLFWVLGWVSVRVGCFGFRPCGFLLGSVRVGCFGFRSCGLFWVPSVWAVLGSVRVVLPLPVLPQVVEGLGLEGLGLQAVA